MNDASRTHVIVVAGRSVLDHLRCYPGFPVATIPAHDRPGSDFFDYVKMCEKRGLPVPMPLSLAIDAAEGMPPGWPLRRFNPADLRERNKTLTSPKCLLRYNP